MKILNLSCNFYLGWKFYNLFEHFQFGIKIVNFGKKILLGWIFFVEAWESDYLRLNIVLVYFSWRESCLFLQSKIHKLIFWVRVYRNFWRLKFPNFLKSNLIWNNFSRPTGKTKETSPDSWVSVWTALSTFGPLFRVH